MSGKATDIEGGEETIKAIRRKPLTASTIDPIGSDLQFVRKWKTHFSSFLN